MKRLSLFIVSFTFAIAALGSASIVARPIKCDPIQSGLKYGAENLQIGTTCENQSTVGSTQSQTSLVNTGNLYVAMGDSVTAGLGLEGQTGDSRCGQTAQGYPNIVAAETGMQLVNLACSGATAGDLVTRQGVSGRNIAAQLDQAFANGTPKLITITAGANDMQWVNYLRKCYASTCGTGTDTSVASGLRNVLETKYSYALSEIQRRSNWSPPRVIVTGYYNPVSNYCKNRQTQFSSQEISWLNKQRDELNKSIRRVAGQYDFVKYASANFTGHTVCSSEPWSQGINDAAPLHPTARGQEVIAQSVLRQIR